MRIQVTLTFENESVWFRDSAPASRFGDPTAPVGVNAKVQFCVEYFENGQTREFKVFDTYEVQEYVTPSTICHPAIRASYSETHPAWGHGVFQEDDMNKPIGYATHIVGEWDKPSHNLVHRHTGCGWTAHVWTCGCDCGCNRMAASIFTPHELGVRDNEEGSVTTRQGVTIAWKRIKEEEDHETSTCRTDGCCHHDADGVPHH